MPYSNRHTKILALLESKGLDALLVYSSRFDSRFLRWLTGITCNSAFHYYLVTRSEVTFLEISYRVSELQEKTKAAILPISEENQAHIAIKQATAAYKQIGLIGYAPYAHVAPIVDRIQDLTLPSERLLLSKSRSEQDQIEKLSASLLNAIVAVGRDIEVGMSEKEIEENLAALLSRCSDRLACPITVLSGDRLKRGTVGKASDRRLASSDALLIDAAVAKDGLFSDLTRMFFTGPSQAFENYQLLTKAQQQILAGLEPGMLGPDVLQTVRTALQENGLPKETLTIQDLGHGIGFSLHEEPFYCTPTSDSYPIAEGAVFTIEPEILLNGAYLRIEDMVAMRQSKLVAYSHS